LRRKAVLLQVSDFGLGRGFFLSEALARLGFEVDVITNRPVYQKSLPPLRFEDARITADEFDMPFGKVLYGTVPGRLLFYALFSAFAFIKMIRARADVLYSRGPQPFTEISCLACKFFSPRTIVISDSTDLWPDSLKYVRMNPTLKSILMSVGFVVNRAVYGRVDDIVTHNELLAKILEKRFHRPTHIIYGVVDLGMFNETRGERAETRADLVGTGRTSKLVVLYAGLLGSFQNPSVLVEIAERLRDEASFVVVGSGPLEGKVREMAAERRLTNLVFLGTQPFQKMPLYYGAADVCILTYANIAFLSIGLPKKFIEYAASGRAILLVSPPCVASDMCASWNAGFRVDADDFEGAATRLRELMANPGLADELGGNARRMAQKLFSVEGAVETLRGVIATPAREVVPN
jgi:glycosyltransferase involved in cell wall biosynthesis